MVIQRRDFIKGSAAASVAMVAMPLSFLEGKEKSKSSLLPGFFSSDWDLKTFSYKNSPSRMDQIICEHSDEFTYVIRRRSLIFSSPGPCWGFRFVTGRDHSGETEFFNFDELRFSKMQESKPLLRKDLRQFPKIGIPYGKVENRTHFLSRTIELMNEAIKRENDDSV